jgi:soluble lytic murein transglycosylase
LTQEYQFRLLAGMALDLGDADLAVKIAKAAAKKKIMLPVEGYPVLAFAEAQQKPWLVHAITRQESQFDERVVSSSNAQGLMQLLPSTAHEVAGKIGMDQDSVNLFDPETNVRLGSWYINNLVDRFDGSLPMAIAGYNAGPGRVRQWMDKFGDPRAGQMDMIDWVENIPVDETRNYVQRVLEALQLYRAKFSGGNAPLEIERDLL